MQMKATLLGWYNWDNTLFDGFTVPAGLDKETAVNTILMRCGEFGVIYSNPDFLKFAITNWSDRHQAQFTRMVTALAEQYNPIHNYDRYEGFKDVKSGNRDVNGKLTSTGTSDSTEENTISADNAKDYQPDSKSTTAVQTGNNSTDNTNESYSDTIKHDSHLYGNIGVTTSQQMLESEIDLRYKFGIYDLIAAKFVEEFCIAIY